MEIYVCSNVGATFLASPIVSMTMPSPTAISTAPSPSRMLTMTGAPTGSTVELNWLPPLYPNGVIHYEIEYEPAMTPGDPVNAGNSSSPYFTLTLPNEFLTYNVTVAAVNTQGQARSGDLAVPCLGKNTLRGSFTKLKCKYSMQYCQCYQPVCNCSLYWKYSQNI